MLNLETLAFKVNELKTLPTMYMRIRNLVEDPDTSAEDVSDIIAQDPVIAAKILRIVNSAFYSFPSKIDDICQAVMIIGFSGIIELVFSLSVTYMFIKCGNDINLNRGEMWKHSLGCAVFAKTIGKYTQKLETEELFTAGLLHDIGKIIIDQYLPVSFAHIIEQTSQNSGRLSIMDAEKQHLGYSHAEVGALVAEKWRLPQSIVEGILYHHTFQSSRKCPRHVAAVHIANSMVKALSLGYSGYRRVPLIDALSMEAIGLRPSLFEKVMEESLTEYFTLSTIFA